MPITIRRAAHTDAPGVAPLFEQYCIFYDRHPAPHQAHDFIEARLRLADSVIFLAELTDPDARPGADPVPAGFVQLYPKWSSTTMRRDWILNDLFVAPAHRRRGIARALMTAATGFAHEAGAAEIALKTQTANTQAQALYESLGWRRDDEFITYELSL